MDLDTYAFGFMVVLHVGLLICGIYILIFIDKWTSHNPESNLFWYIHFRQWQSYLYWSSCANL